MAFEAVKKRNGNKLALAEKRLKEIAAKLDQAEDKWEQCQFISARGLIREAKRLAESKEG